MGNCCSCVCNFDNELNVEFKYISKFRIIGEKYLCTFVLPKKTTNDKYTKYIYLGNNDNNNMFIYFLKYILEFIFINIGENIICDIHNNNISTNIKNNKNTYKKMKKIYKYQNDEKYYYFDIYSKYQNNNIENYRKRKITIKKDTVDRFYFIIY